MTLRHGDWIQTFTGRQFWPLDPRPEEVSIADIAHALSMQCRFTGHCREFYSVAEHSVFIALHVAKEHRWAALMHDSPEGYLIDLARPVKKHMPTYAHFEKLNYAAICQWFGFSTDIPQAVHAADFAILFDERNQNMAAPPVEWDNAVDPLGVELQFWTPKQAEFAFLTLFNAIMDGDDEPFELHPRYLSSPARLIMGKALLRAGKAVRRTIEKVGA